MAAAPELPAIVPDMVAAPVEAVIAPSAAIVAPIENTIGNAVTGIIGTSGPALIVRQGIVGGLFGAATGFLAAQLLGHKEVKGSNLDPGFLTRLEETLGMTAQVALATSAGAGAAMAATALQIRGSGAWGAVAGTTAVALPYLMM